LITPEPATPEPTPVATPDACAPDAIAAMLKNPGRLTLSTDLPAFPPWQGGDQSEPYPNEPEGGSPWSEIDFSAEPYAGEGFEGAMAYAVAERMGFTPDLVDWVANNDFNAVFTPAEKPVDVHMAQISATEERAEVVTFSDPYFLSNQSLLALTSNPITAATTIEELKSFHLGAALGTTSLDLITDVIQPTVEHFAYNDNAGGLQALQAGGEDGLDGLIVDLSTAFYMRDAELEDFETEEPEGTIVGQFGPPAEPDNVAFLLEQGNPLVDCVNQALAELMADGTHQEILDTWINTGQEIPFLE
jgi:polar amino acid transport system substrate-binding protein